RWAARARPGSARRRSPTSKHIFAEPRRRHLLPLRPAGDPRRGRRERQHHLQDPLQRRGGDDRRPAGRRRRSRVPQIAAPGRAPRACERIVGRSADEPRRSTRRGALASRPASPSTTATSSTRVQRELREIAGVTVLRLRPDLRRREARRRRKRGKLVPDPARRVVINELVCEGCGDCGVQSQLPVDRAARDRVRPQARASTSRACNKDYSCLKGFCPSFVTVEGGELQQAARPRPRRAAAAAAARAGAADARPSPTASSSPASAAPAW
ncbi:MAG: hypothetical protein MZW92_21720, partial [Comamonadaceae bacterium]|nr:hypothetical protein [Comamonadaceae bacterium]